MSQNEGDKKMKKENINIIINTQIPVKQTLSLESNLEAYKYSSIAEKETKDKIRKSLCDFNKNRVKDKKKNLTVKTCKVCGDDLCHGNHINICKHTKKWFINLECFGFDLNKFGTLDVFDEFEKIKKLLYKEYFVNMLSVDCIVKKYNYTGTTENFVHILKDGFGFKLRTFKESTSVSIEEGRYKINSAYSFKTGYKMTWDGKMFFYRSSYELKYSEYLDDQKIKYNYESLRIKYFDTEKNKTRIAVPDFYLIDYNQIVEVKSRVTFKKQNIIDKFESYIKHGYDPLLFYEGESYTLEEVKEKLCDYDYLLSGEY